MIALFRTYLDVIFLRKGPDAIPASWLVLYVSLAILAVSWSLQLLQSSASLAAVAIALVAYALALLFYSAIVVLFGFGRRLLQMLSTLIACGSIIALTSAAIGVLLEPLAGGVAAATISSLVWFWSVPVKGHIIAVTIEKHWFVGIGIAMLAYIFRYGIVSSFVLQQQSGAV
ncbi:MAG: hypothetical protein R3315_11845 [Woeseiaceae bacterium]|nr:hypothetical protein [Woeseiaceae bacterium]